MEVRPVWASLILEDGVKMKRLFTATLFVLFAMAIMPGCAGMMGSERRDTNAEVILESYGSINGELAPCG